MERVEAVEAAVIESVPLWNDRTGEHGPFDIFGDLHGCADELEQLLKNLCYDGAATTMAIRSGEVRSTPIRKAAKRFSSATLWIVGHEFSIRCESFETWCSTGAEFAFPEITT